MFLDPVSTDFNALPAAACYMDPTVSAAMMREDMAPLLNAAKHYIKAQVCLVANGYIGLVLFYICRSLNEKADAAAKSALSLPVTNMKLPSCELIPYVFKFCLAEWQDIWNCCEGNKLHSIYSTVGIATHSKNISRNDSVIINRLRIGHCRLTHSYLLSCCH